MADRAWIGRVGGYRLVEEIGRGGAGTVYRAVDPAGRAVALKVLTGASSDAAATERFLRESSIRIRHPNVVQTLGGGLDDEGRPYAVLELLRGSNLRERIKKMPEAELVEAIRQAALGIGAIHQHGLVHRDLKPENLFRMDDGTIKVLDLGIATWADGHARVTATGAVIGTPAYLAPEQARGDRNVHPSADVWALGVILYEGLSGRSPFRRSGALATLLAVTMDPVLPLGDLAPGVAPAIADVVHRCLERTPEARYAGGGELAHAPPAARRAPTSSLPRASSPSRAASSRRSIALVLARPGERDVFEQAVREHGGDPVVLVDGRAIGLFGAVVSRGDETRRAMQAARALAETSALVAIGVGHAEVGARAPAGDAVRDAEGAFTRGARGIVCGPATARQLATECTFDELAPDLFAVSGGPERPAESRPLLGREVELAMMRRVRDSVHERRGCQVTWIVGPPGVGKSRLAEAVQRLAAEVGPAMEVFEAHAGDVPPTLFAIWARAIDRPVQRSSSEPLDPTARIDLAREEIVEGVAELADAGPVAIVLEDLQWADPHSIDLVRVLSRRLSDRPIWLVLTARPELVERAGGLLEGGAVIEPAPLGVADALALARARGEALSPSAAHDLVEHTQGNPLFLEQLLDARRDVERGSHPEGTTLPASVEHAVQARLDHLRPAERETFTHLALLGWPGAPAELAALGVAEPEVALESLCARGLVVRGPGSGGNRAYRARSPLVASVAAAMPTVAVQLAVHRRAAHLGEASGRDDEQVAIHHAAAGNRSAAARFFARAALGANNGGDARKVLRCGARAVELGGPEVGSFALHFALAEAARWVGEPGEQDRALTEAERLATDESSRAMVESERGDWLRRMGRYDDALSSLDRAVSLARASNDADTLARAAARRATTRAVLGGWSEARVALEELRSLESRLGPVTRAFVEDARGFVAGCMGDHGERRRAFARAAELYASAGDVRRSAGAETNAADASNRLGQYAEAERRLHRAVAAARRVGNRLSEGYAMANIGYALAMLNRTAEARESLVGALDLATTIGDVHLSAAVRLYLARVSEDAEAETILRSLTSEEIPATVRAGALAMMSSRLLAAGRGIEARECAMAALEIRDRAGALEEGEAEVFVAALAALEASGLGDDAARLRPRAVERIGELARHIEDPSARASFLERVSEHRALLAPKD